MNFAEKHHVDIDIVLHILQAVAQQIKAPQKRGDLGMVSPPRRHLPSERYDMLILMLLWAQRRRDILKRSLSASQGPKECMS
jgi:hypothetical protein